MADEKDAKKQSPVLDRLVHHRTLHLFGPVNEDSCNRLIEQLVACQLESGIKPIKLLIHSGGGSANAALRACSVMENIITAPIEGIVIGMCASAATFILLHCNKRSGTKYSEYIIHSGTLSGIRITMDNMTKKNLNDLLEETSCFANMIAELYQEKLGLPGEEVRKLVERGDQDFNKALTASEALSIGLITEIVSGKVGIFPALAPSE